MNPPRKGPSRHGLFIYAVDAERLAAFYEALLGLRRVHASPQVIVLGLPDSDLQLVVHPIPPAIAATIEIRSPPEPREDTALKFFFTVTSLDTARALAAGLGGCVEEHAWPGTGFVMCRGWDPEGNIFQLREFR